ncbi:MAG TPA: 6,7-dimethyl-8-ribityllumazine synthase [bacterium]|mgnify:FL=1|nr:6,7-dimethyl-8-ribityllumazine synthase [bacterium]
MKVLEGELSAKGYRFGIVVSRFNNFITGKLLDGAVDAIVRHGGDKESITVVWVPGAWEIPMAAQRLSASGNCDAVVALGTVIRGGTPHFEYVAAEVSKGLANVGIQAKIPVAFGVLTCDSIEQAIERAGTKAGNKGAEAALAAMEMISIYEKL